MVADDDLERRVAYYARHLDEMAAQRIAIEHHQWALQVQLRQKKKGFELLSSLARSFGAETDIGATFRIAVLAMNSAFEMDRTVVFVPAATEDATAGPYVAAHVAGMPEEDVARVGQMVFELPAEMTASAEPLLVDSASLDTPSVGRLREVFGIDTFTSVALLSEERPLGVIVSGRAGRHPALYRALDRGDLDTFRAVGDVLHAVAMRTRLARFEETARLRMGFYADVAHELRTPLTLTLGPLAQILSGKWGVLPEAIRARLEVVERSQGRLLALVNEVLDLARGDAGSSELRLESLDLDTLVEQCVAPFRPAAEARAIGLELELDERLRGRPILADRQKLERAMFNLLSNALKFTERGRIHVITRDEGDLAAVVVKDTGVGIAEADLPHVFDRFRRAARPHVEGSGIGLAVVKQAALMHRGDVTVESRRGEGSRFTLVIPIRPAPPTRAPQPAVPARETVAESNRRAEAAYDPSKPVVLYVEDDPDLRAHVRDMLADAYNLFVAEDGVEGLEHARRYQPDAIVSDQMMPRMDGSALLRALRDDAELATIPVVFLTAQHGSEGRIESLAAGADDFISKPFHEAELRARIANLIRARRNERELAGLARRLRMQVAEQMADLGRAGELERFLPRAVVARLRASGDGRGRTTPVRRQVTILATELSALAELGERLEEPAVAAIASEYVGAVATICAGHGGLIDGFAGGRVSAIFGVSDEASPGEAAWSAARAAMAIHEKTKSLNADARRRGLPGDARPRLGIASGSCVVGAFGDTPLRTFTAIGPAARAAPAIAAPGVVCDDATRVLLGARARLRPGGDGSVHEILSLVEPQPNGTEVLPAAPVPQVSIRAADRVLRREGEYWTIGYHGRVVRLRSAKGLDYLAHLLMRPHDEVHVLELAGTTVADGKDPRTVEELADLGLSAVCAEPGTPVLDRRAKQAYRERLADLDEQICEGTSLGDPGRVARAEAEREALARELASALGLGGRDRRASAQAERVRINVTRAIKAVLGKIMDADGDLGRHLATSVRTGMFCSYAPHRGVSDDWHVTP